MENIKLTSENVYEIFTNCLFKDDEVVNNTPMYDFVVADGILNTFVFHAKRLEISDKKIGELIKQLPEFDEPISFLNLCLDKEGKTWGEHINMEQLVTLGVACGYLDYTFPKDMWEILPGRMPFISGTDKLLEKTNSK